jgi:hypothetical protein
MTENEIVDLLRPFNAAILKAQYNLEKARKRIETGIFKNLQSKKAKVLTGNCKGLDVDIIGVFIGPDYSVWYRVNNKDYEDYFLEKHLSFIPEPKNI